jgi:hypothetical protein
VLLVFTTFVSVINSYVNDLLVIFNVYFQAHALDPLFIKNMDLYSYLLAKEKKTVELQR